MNPFIIKSIVIGLFVSAILFSLDAIIEHILIWGTSSAIITYYMEILFLDVTFIVNNYRYHNVLDTSKNFKLYLVLYVFKSLLIAILPFFIVYLYNQSIQSAEVIIENSTENRLYLKLIIILSVIGGFIMLSIKEKFDLILQFFWLISAILIIVISILYYETKLLIIIASTIGGLSLMMNSLEQLDKKLKTSKFWIFLANTLSFGLYSYLKR